MTKEKIIELQIYTSKARALLWQELQRGGFPDEEYAKAIFTCYFTLDKVASLVSKYLAQLPLEAPAPLVDKTPVRVFKLIQGDTPSTDSLWPLEPEPKSQKKVNK